MSEWCGGGDVVVYVCVGVYGVFFFIGLVERNGCN